MLGSGEWSLARIQTTGVEKYHDHHLCSHIARNDGFLRAHWVSFNTVLLFVLQYFHSVFALQSTVWYCNTQADAAPAAVLQLIKPLTTCSVV